MSQILDSQILDSPVQFGIAIPDSAEELLDLWGLAPRLTLIGGKATGSGRWWQRKRPTWDDPHDLTVWPMPAELPATLTWEVDVRCYAHSLRLPTGEVGPLDVTPHMLPGDLFRLVLTG